VDLQSLNHIFQGFAAGFPRRSRSFPKALFSARGNKSRRAGVLCPTDFPERETMLGTILLIIIILLLIGALPRWGYSRTWGYGPSGGLGLVLLIVIILLIAGYV
tara:strand:+ start:326 stop:637 length:312 start_codon:yes stop_codon:yes gene_type:complete